MCVDRLCFILDLVLGAVLRDEWDNKMCLLNAFVY
jgi:hypothetical protein